MPSTSSPRVLYVLEEGGEWPRWLNSSEAANHAVIRQNEGESPTDFATRVARELEALADKSSIERAIVACNERSDARAIAERREIGQVILRHLATLGRGSLLFTESQRQSGGSRAQLSGLATDLSDEWEEAGLSVSVRFGQPSKPPQESIPPPSASRPA